MRYLGLGVGHLNPSDFPREHDILREDLLSEEGEAWRFTILEESDDEFSESENGDEEHDLMEEDGLDYEY